jgi:hypothetical protein
VKKPFLALLVLFIVLQAEYVDFMDRYNVPIYGVKQVNSVVWIAVFRKLCEQNNIGWHFGHIRKWGIASFTKPENFDAIITYSDSTKSNFEEIRKLRPGTCRQQRNLLINYSSIASLKICCKPGIYNTTGIKSRQNRLISNS